MLGILKNALSWLLFMPNFFPPLPVGRIETFPWATFFSVDRRLTLPAAYTFVMALFLLSAGYSLYTYGNPISVLRSYLSLINASLIFYRIWNTDGADFLRIVKALISVLCLHLVLSLWQFSGTVPDAIMDFVQYFTPRATGEAPPSQENGLGLENSITCAGQSAGQGLKRIPHCRARMRGVSRVCASRASAQREN